MSKTCSACRHTAKKIYLNPLLGVPICENCYAGYNSGEFTIDGSNETYCRWCGQGEGVLLLCDTCPKAFCTRCITNNFGLAEVERIKGLEDRWSCLICSPETFRDLCLRNRWRGFEEESTETAPKRSRSNAHEKLGKSKHLICYDVSRGREKYEIPVINEYDDAPPPLDFTYITSPVAGEGVQITNNPNFLSCCSCTDGCRDPTKCQCLMNSEGINYHLDGRLVRRKNTIYECNYRCACNINRCTNRVVGSGPRQRLEVFRCKETYKGWGVRCRTELPLGTFVGDYLGEIIPESLAEKRGLVKSDEYIYNIDSWGRSEACRKLDSLGMKHSFIHSSRETFTDITCLKEEDLKAYLDEDTISMLSKSGAIKRALDWGQRLHAMQEGKLFAELFANAETKKESSYDSLSSSSSSVAKKQKTTFSNVNHHPWIEKRLRFFHHAWAEASSIVNDRAILAVEATKEALSIDAR
jgi:hypothetical protein